MTGVELWDVDISGEVRGLRINGVDVTAYVEEEMARREPDLAKMHPDDPAGFVPTARRCRTSTSPPMRRSPVAHS